MTVRRQRLLVLAAACVGLALAGCRKSEPTFADPVTGEPADSSAPHAAGKKVFVANCARCHSVAVPAEGSGRPAGPGPGGVGGFNRGPNLNKTGRDPVHTVAWFTEFIRNPQSKKENARMPAFDEARIGSDDLRALAEFLASLK